MPMTATPVFVQTPNSGATAAVLTAAMSGGTQFSGTETVGNAFALVFTAGANGSRIDQVIVRYGSPAFSVASGTSSASVIRFFINNGQVNTTPANNIYIGEVAMAAQTVTSAGTSVLATQSLTLPTGGLNIPAGYRIYAGPTVAPGGTSIAFIVNAFGGDY